MRWRKKITYCDLICSIASVSRVSMHYTQSSSPWSRAICHYVCHPPGRTVGQKTRPSGWRSLSCARQRAMKGVSLFIRFDQPCELWAVYINTWFSFTGRSSTSLGESFANYHSAYASTPTHAAYANGLRCIASRISRSNRYTFSPSPADDCRKFEQH